MLAGIFVSRHLCSARLENHHIWRERGQCGFTISRLEGLTEGLYRLLCSRLRRLIHREDGGDRHACQCHLEHIRRSLRRLRRSRVILRRMRVTTAHEPALSSVALPDALPSQECKGCGTSVPPSRKRSSSSSSRISDGLSVRTHASSSLLRLPEMRWEASTRRAIERPATRGTVLTGLKVLDTCLLRGTFADGSLVGRSSIDPDKGGVTVLARYRPIPGLRGRFTPLFAPLLALA